MPSAVASASSSRTCVGVVAAARASLAGLRPPSRPTSAPSRTSTSRLADRLALGEVRPQQPLLQRVLSPVLGGEVDQAVRVERVAAHASGRSRKSRPSAAAAAVIAL